MAHYVCTGDCKNISPEPGICQSDFCNKQGEELKICGCEDGEHNHSEETSSGEVSSETN